MAQHVKCFALGVYDASDGGQIEAHGGEVFQQCSVGMQCLLGQFLDPIVERFEHREQPSGSHVRQQGGEFIDSDSRQLRSLLNLGP